MLRPLKLRGVLVPKTKRGRANPELADYMWNCVVLSWLREGVPLRPEVLEYIADELEQFWFRTPQERRVLRGKRQRERAARVLQWQIDQIVGRDGGSEKAIEIIAERNGVTVEAIKLALLPTRISGARRRTTRTRSSGS
jgi:hypothetical protein